MLTPAPRRPDASPEPPRRVWRDWALVVTVVVSWVPELLLRDDLAWPAVSVAVSVVLLLCLLVRRTAPLPAALAAFGAVAVANVALLVRPPEGDALPLFWSTGVLLLFPYALLRWAAVREAGVGMGVALVWVVFSSVTAGSTLSEAVAGVVFFGFSGALGATMRYRASARRQELDQARLSERVQLARELHDSVAHHVSAIALQAQGGRLVATTAPGHAEAAFAAIEEASSRALREMRAMVGALREGEGAALAPRPGLSDVVRLARDTGEWPRVDVGLTGHLDDLDPAVGTAVYRIAQESVTNAIRHARHATRVDVRVVGVDGCVRVTVRDDGQTVSVGRAPWGYGLTGMAERAALLGGTLEAGPASDGGWTVSAVLPRTGAAT